MQEGASTQEMAKRFEVSKRTVERYWKRFEQTG
jgi:transposase